MRLPRGSYVLVTVVDGTVLRGRVERSWRWRVVRLVDAHVVVPPTVAADGRVPAAGPVLVPHRSIVLAQEVSRDA